MFSGTQTYHKNLESHDAGQVERLVTKLADVTHTGAIVQQPVDNVMVTQDAGNVQCCLLVVAMKFKYQIILFIQWRPNDFLNYPCKCSGYSLKDR